MGVVSITPLDQSTYTIEVQLVDGETVSTTLYPFLTADDVNLSDSCWDHEGLALTPIDNKERIASTLPVLEGGPSISDFRAFALAGGRDDEACYKIFAVTQLTWK